MTRPLSLLWLAVLLLVASPALAWWDTVITVVRGPDLIREIDSSNFRSEIPFSDDTQANGGRGGKVLRLEPGGPGLSVDLDLEPGLYCLYGIARDPSTTQWGRGVATLEVTDHTTGRTRSWSMVIAYTSDYHAAIQMYFPADNRGKYTATIKLEKDLSKIDLSQLDGERPDKNAEQYFGELERRLEQEPFKPLLVDRLELRNPLWRPPFEQTKQRRMLTSDEELAQIRNAFKRSPEKTVLIGRRRVPLDGPKAPRWATEPRTEEERAQRNEELWSLTPDYNLHTSNYAFNRYNTLLGQDGGNGLIHDHAMAYRTSGHPELAFDAAVLLCAMAEKYPAVDFYAQSIGEGKLTAGVTLTGGAFSISTPRGKNVYRGWSSKAATRLIESYDALFDYIKDNQALADYLSTKLPGIRTPDDVIRFLDQRLLFSIFDSTRRIEIGGDVVAALVPCALGPGPASDYMLEHGLFEQTALNMTHRGGIDDQAICSYSRDGVHYIGSVGYLTDSLAEIADLLHRYVQAGGNPRFDLLEQVPHVLKADETIAQLRAAGGYRFVVGDAGDLRNLRESGFQSYPSRILGGFGETILETRQSGTDIEKAALGIYFGLGRGHAHQDTLNLELFALGCRVSPDLGGRHEGRFHGRPNMRSNRVHNLVEVDERDFHNPYAGSTTSATGWVTGFSPMPGSQFAEHAARATSHPHVSTYARQTALVDVAGSNRDSYIFDVFRVAGGKVHTYSFHGAPTRELASNVELSPATSPEAVEYLRKYYEGSQQEGVAPAILQADWVMDQDLQQRYQGDLYEASRPVTTRLHLFGQEGLKVLVGNAYSDHYKYNFPFLYVQRRQQTSDAVSVFPAIIEPFAGAPVITDRRALPISPEQTGVDAGVAVGLTTVTGRTDVLYASARPTQAVKIDNAVTASGKYALISRDSDGVRLAHLVGGTELAAGDIAIRTERPAYRVGITAVDYRNRSFTTEQPLPGLLAGANVVIGNERQHHAFQIEKIEGSTVTHFKPAKYYQSKIVHIDEQANLIECEIEPVVFGCDPAFIDGSVIANEAQDKTWRVSVIEGDRWMHIGFPGYRTSHPNTISLEQIPDADKDGRRTLRLMEAVDEAPGRMTQLLELEVTRVSDDGQTFYFKLPADARWQRGGWQYTTGIKNPRVLLNEDGTHAWRSLYPGSSFLWKPETPIRKADFTDADGDGRIKMAAYLYGVGDTMQLDSSVYVRRLEPGRYEVRANVACTITLPVAGKLEISADGETFRPIDSKSEGAGVTVELTEDDLADGTVIVRVAG